VRPWLERLGRRVSLDRLNQAAEETDLRTASGRAVRFVPPGPADPYYEVHLHETGRVQTRPENLHDLFNALVWLAFPKTKALINALHAEEIPREHGRRGSRRDLLTLLDEGGALVECDDAELVSLARNFEWKALFWQQRERVRRHMRILILGHATLEQALEPRPGIACKAVFVPRDAPADEAARAWLAALPKETSPRQVPPLPVFGYPGWLPESERADFYDDSRYFRGKRDKAAPAPQAPLPDDGP
jgi:hypothetical protein